METTAEKPVSKAVILLRHIVGVSFLLLFQPAVPAGDLLSSWMAAAITVFGAATVITALAYIFFTRRESGRSTTTFAITSWVLAVLILVGQSVK
jgi:FtsH-binding integral membrane protein